MRILWRWLKRLITVLVLLILGLLSPVLYVETMCRGEDVASDYTALLPPEHHRTESRTLMTYPEWHIVHAYDDYAEVIRTGDPHDFNFFQAITGYWSSLCTLSEASAAHGGIDGPTRQMVHVIGVSFTAELLLKAAYEETVGRAVTWLRGPDRAPLDELSAGQAGRYARFLQQVPWYRWDFAGDAQALRDAAGDSLRDRERSLALGLEFRAKAAYARVIAAAVASTGFDELRLRMIVSDLPEPLPDVDIIAERPEGLELETPRYRELTHLMARMATLGADFVEIAGNDDILLTVTSADATMAEALHSFPRQGYGDYRQLLLIPVTDLAETLRGLEARGVTLEHIHDY
jgi:hypothetical protein